MAEHNYAQVEPPNIVNLMSLNVYGLKSKTDLGIIQMHINEFDLVGLIETKTDAPNDDWFPGFVTVAAKSPTEDGCKLGGVHSIALFVKKSIYRHVTVLENLAPIVCYDDDVLGFLGGRFSSK